MQALHLRTGMRQVTIMMSVKDFEAKQIVFVFLQQKEKLSFKNDNLVVNTAAGKIKYQITCYRIFALFVVGHFVMTSGLIQRSHKFAFPVFLMTNSMKVYEMFGGRMEGNVVLRRIQYEYNSLEIGKHILYNKVVCQRELLNRQRNKSLELKENIKKIDSYADAIRNYEGDLEGLLGYEGPNGGNGNHSLIVTNNFYFGRWTWQNGNIRSLIVTNNFYFGRCQPSQPVAVV